MLLFYMHADFFSRFLVSRKYSIQIAVLIERKSAVLLSGRLEAS